LHNLFLIRRLRRATNKGLDAFFKFSARQKYAALTRLTYDANVRAEADYVPFVSAARMRFTQAHHIADVNFQRHGD